jgi:hypothetical protein
MEMNDFDRPEGGDEAEGGEDETVIDEDDFIDPLDQTVDELDEVKTSSFLSLLRRASLSTYK